MKMKMQQSLHILNQNIRVIVMNDFMLNCDQPFQTLQQRNSSSNKSLRFHQPVKLYKCKVLV